MSRSKYFIDDKDGRETFEDERTFCDAFNSKNTGVPGVLFENGLEKPVYYIGNEIVFSDSDNKVLCINKEGELQKENNYSIIKRSIDGKDKYIVKKDENSYYRYSIDGRLIDSIEKNEEKNNYTYYAYYGNNGKEKTKIEINSVESINEAIKLSRGQIKIKKEIHGIQPDSKPEEILYDKIIDSGIYPNGNELNNTFFGTQQYDIIKKICEENGVKLYEEEEGESKGRPKLEKKLSSLLESIKRNTGKTPTENDILEAKKYIVIETLLNKLSLKLVGKKPNETITESDKLEGKKFILEKLFKEYNYKIVRLLDASDNLDKIIESLKQTNIIVYDKKTGEKVLKISDIYSNSGEFNTNLFWTQQYDIIRKICEENGVKLYEEEEGESKGRPKLEKKLSSLLESIKRNTGKTPTENDILEAKKYIVIETLLNKLSLKLVGKELNETPTNDDLSEAQGFLLEELFKKYDYKTVGSLETLNRDEKITKDNLGSILKNNELVDIIFSDKDTGNEVSRSSIKPMKLFDATNLAGTTGEGKSTKITRNRKILEDGAHFFVKPVGKPMSFFKKEQNGEFSNHSNFEYEGERKVEASGLLIIKDGKIHNISNSSGHFRQSFESIMTGLAYLASQTEDCNIENLLDPNCKMEDGSYKILTDINKALKYNKDLGQAILDVAKPLTKEHIIAINMKAARMKAKESSKGRSIC